MIPGQKVLIQRKAKNPQQVLGSRVAVYLTLAGIKIQSDGRIFIVRRTGPILLRITYHTVPTSQKIKKKEWKPRRFPGICYEIIKK